MTPAIIAAIAAGVLIAVAILAVILFCCVSRDRRSSGSDDEKIQMRTSAPKVSRTQGSDVERPLSRSSKPVAIYNPSFGSSEPRDSDYLVPVVRAAPSAPSSPKTIDESSVPSASHERSGTHRRSRTRSEDKPAVTPKSRSRSRNKTGARKKSRSKSKDKTNANKPATRGRSPAVVAFP